MSLASTTIPYYNTCLILVVATTRGNQWKKKAVKGKQQYFSICTWPVFKNIENFRL